MTESPTLEFPEYRDEHGDIDPLRIAEGLRTFGTAYANKKHAADLLEKTTISVRAEITNRIKRESFTAGEPISRKEAEDQALASEDYLNHIYAAADARRACNLARANYAAAQALFEGIRSAEATRRQQLSDYGPGRRPRTWQDQ